MRNSNQNPTLFTGTQGLAVTYCCHGEEENKMMAIAQKCGLNLSALPGIIYQHFACSMLCMSPLSVDEKK